ncbi:MAG: hypothetical protein RLZZ628_2151 [Bacteroidota bacterium]
MATITIHYQDGLTRTIDGLQSETLTLAASKSGMNVPLDCATATCGKCQCNVLSGTYQKMEGYDETVISEAETREGYVLGCHVKPTSDMSIALLVSSSERKIRPEVVAMTLFALDYVSKEIVQLVLKTKDGRKLNYSAGQYANIEIPHLDYTPSYAFSGASGKDTVSFLIRLLPNGQASNYLRDTAKVGDTLNITTPLGDFYLRNSKKPILFFAGGTGIAPILAMLERLYAEALHNRPFQSQSANAEGTPIKLFYGATTDDLLVALDRLDAFKTHLPFTYLTCTAEKSDKHPQGYVNQWVTKDFLGDLPYDAYICGPPPMVAAIQKTIAAEGISVTNVFVPY